jgi:hypothetical protein
LLKTIVTIAVLVLGSTSLAMAHGDGGRGAHGGGGGRFGGGLGGGFDGHIGGLARGGHFGGGLFAGHRGFRGRGFFGPGFGYSDDWGYAYPCYFYSPAYPYDCSYH